MSAVCALGLYSGGLDSILAHRVVAAQGIRVLGLKFITPFFDDGLLADAAAYCETVWQRYGIEVRLVDLAQGYMQLLHNPAHGFGKHFNPCIDCKILMLRRAKEMMAQYGASFLFTGEVIGQRPMSQRRDTLRVIERDSGCDDLLLRPLCAKRLPLIRAEREGLVDRELLYGFNGRGRKKQIALAESFGIKDFPRPAGGCVLTDLNLGKRIKLFYAGQLGVEPDHFTAMDIRFLLTGRQFRLPGGYWLIMGRDQAENERLAGLAGEGDWLLRMESRPGPVAVLRRIEDMQPVDGERKRILQIAAGLCARFAKKIEGLPQAGEVSVASRQGRERLAAIPLDDTVFLPWQF